MNITTLSTHALPAELAARALTHLLANERMPVRLIGDIKPLNFPLPYKRVDPLKPEMDTIQEYRPLEVLEYVQGIVSAADFRSD
ncbi:hypothetical protein COAQ111491_08515 [Comamonas aquatilis]|uniref:hypothetical protein n=1 Tax=Comamonas aquatilis TaxID=1778406 RepID=UPI0039F02972